MPAWVSLLLVLAPDPIDDALLPTVDRAKSCGVCHTRAQGARELPDDLHSDLDCVDCHQGRGFNPHSAPELDEGMVDLAKSLEAYAEHAPDAWAACNDCHDEEFGAWVTSIHGPEGRKDEKAKHPVCGHCHGTPHHMTESGQGKAALADRCVSCHDFTEPGAMPTSEYVVEMYRETVHGKMLELGNEKAAGCADCHTGHEVFAGEDPRSTVHPDKRTKTCAACHEGANDRFAAVLSHEPRHLDVDFWGGLTALGFSVLTLGTILFLLIHVLLDFLRAGRNAVAGGHEEHAPDGPVAADAPVERFDVHMRWQHLGMLTTFTTLVVTGWPLKAAHVETSSTLAMLLGGQAGLALVHRIAGALLLVVSAYHLVYLGMRWRRGTLSLEMVPGLKDARDAIGNIAYFLGLRAERPKFGRWTYYEKFDYWAVFWGMVIMGGSGVILWWPTSAAIYLPPKLVDLAHIAHSDEALLALLAIFLWHFYNVHLRPSIFPMSWVWLTGKMTAEALYHEHRAEYERQYGDKAPRPPSEGPTWMQRPVWSFAALGVIVVAALAVGVQHLDTVRALVSGQVGDHGPAVAAAGAPTMTKLDARDKGFDAIKLCFDCHNRAHVDDAKSAFPHQDHFDNGVEEDCKACHELGWHDKLVTSRDGCIECHEEKELADFAASAP